MTKVIINNFLIQTFTILLFTICLNSASCTTATFEITKTYIDNQQSKIIKLGKIKIFKQADLHQAYVETNQPQFVSVQEIDRYNSVILIFKNVNSGQQFRTVAKNTAGKDYSEKIVAILSSQQSIIGFNYVQTKGAGQQVNAQVQIPQKGVEHVFKMQTQQKQVAPEESFFTKYKWPLIIGGVLLYMTMTGAADKGQGQAQPAQ